MMLKAFYSVAGAGNVEKLMIDFPSAGDSLWRPGVILS